VTSIKYDPVSGGEITIDPATYQADLLGVTGRIVLAANSYWPVTKYAINTVRIRFVAGYGGPEAVPAPLKHAIKMMVGHWFEYREPVTSDAVNSLPMAVDALIAPYRRVGF
jgi:uncharacterized phiE125 gp8 family phage protein